MSFKIALLFTCLIAMINILNAQDLPWLDNFQHQDMAEWSIVDDSPFRSGPSNWTISSGALYQTSDIRSTENELSVYKGTHAVAGNPDWSDYYFTVTVSTSDDEGIGVLFRYQDENNYYRFMTIKNTNNWGPPFKRLEKQINGQFTTLAQTTEQIQIPGSFAAKIHLTGDSIYVYENNELLFSVRDQSFDHGKIGLMCYANRGAIFDDVYVGEQESPSSQMADPTTPLLPAANSELLIKVLTLNIWVNGKVCTPSQIADLIHSVDADFVGLQECNNTFGKQVAALTGMYMASGYDCFLFSKTPYTKVNTMFINGINGLTNIDGQNVSVYNFHIRWDEEGDRQAGTMVSTLNIDPAPIQIAIGDFNDEHYSTQISIIEKQMRYCLSDLGWAPSQRVTWPAFGFYGGEGAQAIDLVFCNKASKGRAVEGEIMNLSPILSDHKPVWALLRFPADKNAVGPQLVEVIPYLGAEMIELWFDQDLNPTTVNQAGNFHISPMDGGAAVSVLQAAHLKDVRRVRLYTSPHDYGKNYRITVSGVEDEFGIPVMADMAEKTYTVRENLLKNSGAEEQMTDWQVLGGFTAVSERENQHPYTGTYFFTGKDLEDLSAGTQTVDLTKWAESIDNRTMAAEWNAYFATGYELLGTIKASRCEPYDEAEMIIEFIDAKGHILHTASSKRWDTLFWHPYGETTLIPPGTRRADIHILSYRKIKNGLSNDAAFDNVFFSIKVLDQPHDEGMNLLVNPSAETGDLSGWTVSGPIRARAHEDNKARPLSGYYMFANAGISEASAFQEIDVSESADQIDAGNLYFRWGGYMRDYDAESPGEIRIEFYDTANRLLGDASTGSQKVAEWWYYDTESFVPAGTRSIKYICKLIAVADEGVYFDLLHLIPIIKTNTSVADDHHEFGYKLHGNYPNPFNSGTSIKFSCTHAGHIKVAVYNMLGQLVTTLLDAHQAAGDFTVLWNGTDQFANSAPSGIYIYKLQTADFVQMRKMLLLR